MAGHWLRSLGSPLQELEKNQNKNTTRASCSRPSSLWSRKWAVIWPTQVLWARPTCSFVSDLIQHRSPFFSLIHLCVLQLEHFTLIDNTTTLSMISLTQSLDYSVPVTLRQLHNVSPWKVIQQQQLPNIFRLRGVWGDPDVHDLTPTRTSHVKRLFPTNPQKTFFFFILNNHILQKVTRKCVNKEESHTLSLHDWLCD